MRSLLIVGVIAGLLLCLFGCSTVGVADVDVTMPALELSETLLMVYDFAEDKEQAGRFLAMALLKIQMIPTEGMSDLDKSKIARIRLGIFDLQEEIEDTVYIRLRARSLAVLTASVGQYEDSLALAEFTRILEERDADETDHSEPSPEGRD